MNKMSIIPGGLESALRDGIFNGILEEPVKPFIVKGLFGPDNRPQQGIQIFLAGLTNIPVGKIKIAPPHSGLLYRMFTNITGYRFHSSLIISLIGEGIYPIIF
jgi:hypothetical protein